MRNRRKTFFLLLCFVICSGVYAQEFGFGFDDEETGNVNNPFTISIGGEVSASLLGYIDDFSEGAAHVNLGDIFSGKLNFSAGTSFADGVINLKLQTIAEQPVSIDEAYVRAFFGGLEIEGGLRKLTWGKADSFGPLDVINPLDYSELTDLSDMMNLKIARPLVHISYRIGSFTKIEGVFVPSFEPLRYAEEGRWVPAQMKRLKEFEMSGNTYVITSNPPQGISTVEYAQAGARFTTTIGPADIGIQYYYGRITQPSVGSVNLENLSKLEINLFYNPYHQIGLDYAQVLLGLNIRAELAANLTSDLKGDDGTVYNPSIAWSFGYDSDLFWGINLNLQVNESIRLMQDKLDSDDPMSFLTGNFDIEGGLPLTSTRLIAAISKKFFRDELELRFAALWGIEDHDYLLMPSLIWTKDTVSVEFSGGIFGGDKEGQLGQYKDNTFVKAVLTYKF